MATARSEELRAVAQRVTDALPPTVTDVVLTGSTSRGVADDHSDVELLVVAEELPESPQAVVPLDDAASWDNPGAPIRWVGGLFAGEFVELIWWRRAFVDERVAAIAAGEIVDHQRLRTAEALVSGVPLRGARHAGWAARLQDYPAGLAEKIVDDATDEWIDPVRASLALSRPGDALVLARRVTDDAERILRVVFALNEAWEPGWKRLALILEPLAVKPPRLAERIDAAVRTLDLRALRRLADEALALAPQTAKVARARACLAEAL